MASTSGPSFQHAGPYSSGLEHHTSHCSALSKRDIKPSCSAPQVIDLTSESPTPPVMSHQPLRHLPSPHLHPYAHPQHTYSQHSSAFHRVNNGGHSIEAHGPIPNRGCPYLYYNQPTRQHTHQAHPHTSHTRPLHHMPSSAFSPISMNATVPLQHPTPVESSPVLIDVDQVPDHVRSLPVTSLPNPLIVTSVPMATPTYVQPPPPPPIPRRVDLEPDGHSAQHQHHHYHHHHHHHHHYTQPSYQAVSPTPSHHSVSHIPFPSPPPLHHRHYRRWQHSRGAHQGWNAAHPTPPAVHPSLHPDIWYHLLSIMRPHMAAPVPAAQHPPAWDEQYQQENYETLLNLAEQIGEVKPKGLSRAEIDQLPTYRTTVESKKSNGDSRCVVCLMEFEEKQLVRVLPCMHEYHTRCIDKWLKSNRSCPICRSEVNISD